MGVRVRNYMIWNGISITAVVALVFVNIKISGFLTVNLVCFILRAVVVPRARNTYLTTKFGSEVEFAGSGFINGMIAGCFCLCRSLSCNRGGAKNNC